MASGVNWLLGGPPGIGEEQQAQKPAGLGLLREERGEGAREVQGAIAELLADDGVPLAGRLPGAEEQMDGGGHVQPGNVDGLNLHEGQPP